MTMIIQTGYYVKMFIHLFVSHWVAWVKLTLCRQCEVIQTGGSICSHYVFFILNYIFFINVLLVSILKQLISTNLTFHSKNNIGVMSQHAGTSVIWNLNYFQSGLLSFLAFIVYRAFWGIWYTMLKYIISRSHQ